MKSLGMYRFKVKMSRDLLDYGHDLGFRVDNVERFDGSL